MSLCEKQLLSIARALLKESKIVLIDEATASIDMKTELIIQDTINKSFANCTVITIAHRLSTIRLSHKILVLEEGRMKEFDSPDNLLANPNSLFY